MNLYRLVKETEFRDLSASGVEGHWNKTKDDCINDLFDHPFICLWNSGLVQKVPQSKIAPGRGIGILKVPDGSIKLFTDEELPFGWNMIPEAGSRNFGSELLKAAEVLVLGFPSRKFAGEYDYLINLRHPLATEISVEGFYNPFIQKRES